MRESRRCLCCCCPWLGLSNCQTCGSGTQTGAGEWIFPKDKDFLLLLLAPRLSIRESTEWSSWSTVPYCHEPPHGFPYTNGANDTILHKAIGISGGSCSTETERERERLRSSNHARRREIAAVFVRWNCSIVHHRSTKENQSMEDPTTARSVQKKCLVLWLAFLFFIPTTDHIEAIIRIFVMVHGACVCLSGLWNRRIAVFGSQKIMGGHAFPDCVQRTGTAKYLCVDGVAEISEPLCHAS